MASPRVDIISIGTLSRNRLWNETATVRTAHATTSLIRIGKRSILVDPGLPPMIVGAHLNERTGMRPDQIDTIFLTNFRPAHRAGLSQFPSAKIVMHELEIDYIRKDLQQLIEDSPEEDVDHKHFVNELKLLDRIEPAEDELYDGVDLFPLFGYTPGTCGLLISATLTTTLIAGDAVPTLDHFLAGQVLHDAKNIKAAQESMQEIYEIADLIVPGHDNLFLNPRTQGV